MIAPDCPKCGEAMSLFAVKDCDCISLLGTIYTDVENTYRCAACNHIEIQAGCAGSEKLPDY